MGRHTFAGSHVKNESAKKKRRAVAVMQWGLAVIVLVIVVFPIYWMLISSVKS